MQPSNEMKRFSVCKCIVIIKIYAEMKLVSRKQGEGNCTKNNTS